MGVIQFNYADIEPVTLKRKAIIKALIAQVFINENKKLGFLNYIHCSDDYLLHINKRFLNHDYFTDIITFDLSEGEETIGEVYISVDRVKDNAIFHSITFQKELMRVMLHGSLHLCGYKDKKKSEITIMRQKEEYYLQMFYEKVK